MLIVSMQSSNVARLARGGDEGGGESMDEYRIDELARLAETTVRNVRVYQDRGLLAPPRRDGRVGIYTDAHLARLRLIARLLKRGYTFATIGEMLAVWERGGNLADVLDLESAVGHPWSDEVPGHLTAEQLRESFGAEDTPENRGRAVALGLLEPDGEGYRVPSPRLLSAGAEMVAAGFTLPAVLDLAERIRVHVDAAARDMAATVAAHVVTAHLRGGTPRARTSPRRRPSSGGCGRWRRPCLMPCSPRPWPGTSRKPWATRWPKRTAVCCSSPSRQPHRRPRA